MTKTNAMFQTALIRIWGFGFSEFETFVTAFVSNFDFRISDFVLRRLSAAN
jgi:hypothetical protein